MAEKTIKSITYSDENGGKPQSTIIYMLQGTLEEAVNDAPKLRSKSGLIPDPKAILQRRSFSMSGENVTVTLVYSRPDSETYDPSYSLNVSPGTRSLAEHPALYGISASLVKYLLDGGSPFDWVTVEEVGGSTSDDNSLGTYQGKDIAIIPADKNTPGAVTFRQVIEKYAEDEFGGGKSRILEAVLAGERTYPVAEGEWRETTYSDLLLGILDGIGKDAAPPGPNPGGDWYYNGAEASKAPGDSKWKIVKKWKTGANGKKSVATGIPGGR